MTHFRIPKKTLQLATWAGFAIAIVGSMAYGYLFAIYPLVLVIGALIGNRKPVVALGVLCFAAVLLTAILIPASFFAVSHLFREPRIGLAGLVALVSIIACDLAFADAYRTYRSSMKDKND